jgi:hypothetical protein
VGNRHLGVALTVGLGRRRAFCETVDLDVETVGDGKGWMMRVRAEMERTDGMDAVE